MLISRSMTAEQEELLRKSAIGYFDATSTLERKLETIAELCCSSSDPDGVSPDAIQGVGDMIGDFLIQKRICDHFFFGRTIEQYPICEATLAAELYRLDETHESIVSQMECPPKL